MPEAEEFNMFDKTSTILKNGEINIYGELDIVKKSIWDTSIKVEENGYYWNKTPIFNKGNNIDTKNN